MKVKILLVGLFLFFVSGCTVHRVYYEVPGHPGVYHHRTVYSPGSGHSTTTYRVSPHTAHYSHGHNSTVVIKKHPHHHSKKTVIIKKHPRHHHSKKKVIKSKPSKRKVYKKHKPHHKKKYKKKYKRR